MIEALCAGRVRAILLLGALILAGPRAGRADVVTLNNGMVLEGSVAPITSVGADPTATAEDLRQIIIVDNQLTRTFVPTKQLAKELGVGPAIALERIPISQKVATAGRPIGSVGTFRVDPFDEWGRRRLIMSGQQGTIDLVQGITEITPKWTKVEAIQGTNSYIWTMRVATSSIPREQLNKILYKALDPKNPDQRLRIVQLYLQSERFQEARDELKQLLKEFPDLARLNEQLKMLNQMHAQRVLKEIELRLDAGQFRLGIWMLEQFPSEGVAGETLLKVRESLDELAALETKGNQVKAELPQLLAGLSSESSREALKPITDEILRDLNVNNFIRMADYLRLANDTALTAEQKLSLAVSGWLLGSGSAIENLTVTQSLVQVRDLVRQYLQTARQPERDLIMQDLTSLSGATPDYIAKIIAHMKPPLDTTAAPEPAADLGNPAGVLGAPPAEAGKQEGAAAQPDEPEARPQSGTGVAGLFELTVKSRLSEDPEIKYWVQLPPEYNVYRRYPCIVTLHSAGVTPLEQIDWWADTYVPQTQTRYGHAARHGYIVIAPRWTREHQSKYEYSAREHNAVLAALRDATKRFAIDTDRVFLSGHSMGGDAAWDIGLAHPDLWAGVIPIVATADKYVLRYWENAKYVPFYFVSGEKDGKARLALNADEWDRYLKRQGYDTMVVQYLGRGHEPFHDEIQNLFTWMNLHTRNPSPKEFAVSTLRPWDSFFWWVEAREPKETTTILPAEWGGDRTAAKQAKPAEVNANVLATNGVTVSAGAHKSVTVWLSPEIVNFARPLTVRINGKAQNRIQPSVTTLLEDVRTRGDRQHPFWAKVEN
jgi:predicted esterase